MKQATTYTEQKNCMYTEVHFINSTRRALGVVVFELTDGANNIMRTLTLKTTSIDRGFDAARYQRMIRRLESIGFKKNWAALGHPMSGLRGTVRMWRKEILS